MADQFPRLELIGDRTERWRLETADLLLIRNRLGDELLGAFIRCFVHSDRLVSLAHIGRLNASHVEGEVATKRNFLTIIWFAAGTLRETALALRQLRTALAKSDWLDPALGPLDELREVESRWEDDPFLRNVRNTQSFHVDREVVTAGLDHLCSRKGHVVVAEGQGTIDYSVAASLGSTTLWWGLGATEDQLLHLLDVVYADTKIYLAIDQVFLGVLKRIGCELDKRPWSDDGSVWAM